MQQYLDQINRLDLFPRSGKVLQYVGLVIEASGPEVNVGDICKVFPSNGNDPIFAEVVGFRDSRVLLMPFGRVKGISLGSDVVATGLSASIKVGNAMLGRVLDAFARPLDDKEYFDVEDTYPLYSEPSNPLQREKIDTQVVTGIKSIDSFLPMALGQRMGIFAGSGVGKSSLLGMFSRNIDSDINVIALIGERGREVREFVEDVLGEEGMKRSVVVVATADQPALVRTHAVYAAMAIAEFFKDQGKKVLLTLDSITRFAMAQREIGLAVGEPPTSRGYTPSVFSSLSPIVERAGNFENKGSISALFTVLVEGDDLNDPISDYMRGILDGHIVLSRELANKGVYPSIDILKSKSRLFEKLVNKDEREVLIKALTIVSRYMDTKEMIDIGAYESGTNAQVDSAIRIYPKIIEFIKQEMHKSFERKDVFSALSNILRES
ncbi:MAG: FliI/YscN family ATPase [Kangiellaceae bacterium]|nr:FliI/YscN family ATPase [Kangiellaceae bacterium]MCW8997669.1 FliI/YscN family ATPase [Kangiellaceae bacterium]